ncbi:MAG: serine hydrolase [Chloroflexi bacterium]|nr:serine hydrolase [Chloroflexota bacterium]
MLAEIDALMQELIKADEPGAVVAVVKAGEVIHRQGYGLANLEWGIPIQPDTVFRLASITKQFTATAIMILQEQGKLHVNDPLTKFLPNYPTSGHEITVHQLLTHTSGIKSYTSIDGWFPHKIIHDMTPQALCDIFSQIPFDFKPGTQFLYNNSGYHLLGMMIEKVSGVTYEQFIQTNIFGPLGMQHSYYMSNEPIIAKRASGYAMGEQGFRNADYLSMTQPYAAGSLGSTIDDLVLWDRAVRKHSLVSAATQALMFEPVKLADGKTENYGYGWAIGDYRGHRFVHHSGGINGFSTFIAQFQDQPLSLIVLTNNSGFDVGNCSIKIARQALGLPVLERTPVAISAAALERATGTYAFNPRWPWVVTQQDNGLILKTDKEEKLLPLSEFSFYSADNVENEIHFSEEKDGKFQQLALKSPLASFNARRISEA